MTEYRQALQAINQAQIDAALKKIRAASSGNYRPSASRLIAFISAMLLFVVGLSATCFFLYFYLANGVAPDLTKLSAILIALGIGMAPYALNKVTNAASK